MPLNFKFKGIIKTKPNSIYNAQNTKSVNKYLNQRRAINKLF